MSVQLESRHFFRVGDSVRHRGGSVGAVLDSASLYATVLWDDGRREEIDQFEPAVVVTERAQDG